MKLNLKIFPLGLKFEFFPIRGGQPQDNTEFGAGSGVQVQVASRGLPLRRPTSLPFELYFQYFFCFFIYLCYRNIYIILIIFYVLLCVWYFSCFSMFFPDFHIWLFSYFCVVALFFIFSRYDNIFILLTDFMF